MNISEGRRREVIDALAAAAGDDLLDIHSDRDHNRSVFTMIGEDAPRRLAAAAVQRLDLRSHTGVHPRIGVVDVVPFVALEGSTFADAVTARNRFAAWAAAALAVPCFLYGEERTLPDIRRGAFSTLEPDTGPSRPHRTAGAMAVGARALLVAYNLWLRSEDVGLAKRIAAALRSPSVRALGLDVGGTAQVSMNLIAPAVVGPAQVYDAVGTMAAIERAELVGLLPAAVLAAIDPERYEQLDVGPDRTIEARVLRRTRNAG
ncbi:MAG: glutamate formiminotransferase [Acidimicrobiia bacterium]